MRRPTRSGPADLGGYSRRRSWEDSHRIRGRNGKTKQCAPDYNRDDFVYKIIYNCIQEKFLLSAFLIFPKFSATKRQYTSMRGSQWVPYHAPAVSRSLAFWMKHCEYLPDAYPQENGRLVGGPLVAAVVVAGLFVAGLPSAACWCAGVTALCGIWWIFEPIAIPATSILPFALFPLLGVLDHKQVAACYGHHVILARHRWADALHGHGEERRPPAGSAWRRAPRRRARWTTGGARVPARVGRDEHVDVEHGHHAYPAAGGHGRARTDRRETPTGRTAGSWRGLRSHHRRNRHTGGLRDKPDVHSRV